MNKQKGFITFELVIILVFVFGLIGYSLNIYKLTQCDFEEPYKAEAVHGAGLIPIVGMFTGYMDFGK